MAGNVVSTAEVISHRVLSVEAVKVVWRGGGVLQGHVFERFLYHVQGRYHGGVGSAARTRVWFLSLAQHVLSFCAADGVCMSQLSSE